MNLHSYIPTFLHSYIPDAMVVAFWELRNGTRIYLW